MGLVQSGVRNKAMLEQQIHFYEIGWFFVFCFFSLVIEMKNHSLLFNSLLFHFLPYVWTPDASFKSTWEEV